MVHDQLVARPAITAVLETAEHLSAGVSIAIVVEPVENVSSNEVDKALLTTAASVLAQLRLLHSMTAGAAQARKIAVDAHLAAEEHSIASPGAIGVAGDLADLLGAAADEQIAIALTGARAFFADDDLLNGAASLLAAVAAMVADRLHITPQAVIDDVATTIALPTWSRRSVDLRRCRRHRPNV